MLFTSGLSVFFFVRDSRGSCVSRQFFPCSRGKSTSSTRVRSFVRALPLKTISTSPTAAGMACRSGHHWGVKRGCSVSGISSWNRKRHFVLLLPRTSPHREVSSGPTNDHRYDQRASSWWFNTRSQPLPSSSLTPAHLLSYLPAT